MIYFVQTRSGGPIKIGFTERPTDRFTQLRYEFQMIVCVQGVMPGDKTIETGLHRKFAPIQAEPVKARTWDGYFNDWFHPEPELLDYIARHCVPWDGENEREMGGNEEEWAEPAAPFQDLIPVGERYGRLTVIGPALSKRRPGRKRLICYPCQCECGVEVMVPGGSLRAGHSTSCGCYNRERVGETARVLMTKHGETGTPLYQARNNMLMRCRKLGNQHTKNYGDRGIDVCQEWRGSYEAFRDWALANDWEPGLTIDRIDPNGNYEPSNCRWVSAAINGGENKRTLRYAEAFGERKTLSQWARDPRCPVNYKTFFKRLKEGWSIEDAITKPLSNTNGPVEAFGESKTTYKWIQDPRCLVDENLLYERLKDGWNPEEAMTTIRVVPTFEGFGESRTAKQWSEDPRCKVRYELVCRRLKAGWPVEGAITLTPAEGKKKPFDPRKRNGSPSLPGLETH